MDSGYKSLSKASYESESKVPGFFLLTESPTIKAYKRASDNAIVIAVRGTYDAEDVKADALLLFNALTSSNRYKRDLRFVKKILDVYGYDNVYVTGHSLGGAIAEQLKRDIPQIKGGTTFNPAYQLKDLFNTNSNIQKKYSTYDPLSLIGRIQRNVTITPSKFAGMSNKGAYGIQKTLKSHGLESFE
jgi:hypothetical protein